jgi:Flp pilus assembly pilin Flp
MTPLQFWMELSTWETPMNTKIVARLNAGQGLAEYALILALIAITAVVALMFLSGAITAILSQIGEKL